MKRKLRSIIGLCLLSGLIVSTVGCKKKKEDKAETQPDGQFHVTFAVGDPDAQSATYVQSLTDLSSGNISFSGFGFEVPSTRTARVYVSNDGKSLYNLDYGGGQIYKYDAFGGQDYRLVTQTNIQGIMGTTNPRWTKINDQYALLHHVVATHHYQTNPDSVYTHSSTKVILATVELGNMTVVSSTEFTMPMSEEEKNDGFYVSRIDAPVIQNGKAFYGVAKSKYDPAKKAAYRPTPYTNATSLVVDFPSLANPTYITTDVAAGATNGYRTPVAHKDENGDVYQIITVPNTTYGTNILKITNGSYDDNYDFGLSAELGSGVISNGWFYVGNGIGYVPYTSTTTSAATWGVARVDLYSKTAVKLNLPSNLWMQQYQYSIIRDGKFYMAIAAKGASQGNIYIFDPTSASPDAFTKGATLQSGADAVYIGIF
jgi:hypothetical protein